MRVNIIILVLLLVVPGCTDEVDTRDILEILDLPEDVSFTFLPTDLNSMNSFVAIGQVTGIPKGHGGFTLDPGSIDLVNPSIPVYAMSDGVIYNIRWESIIVAQGTPTEFEYDDYALNIALTKTAKMHYGHLSRLAPDILAKAGTLKKGRGVENRVEIHFKAGDILAYIGRHPGFDIGLTDTKKEHWFANPSRYPIEYRSYIPFTDYLTAALRDPVWEMNPRTVEPLGGKINYDVDGTLSGNWFLEGTVSLDQWSRQLIFARHELYADKVYIADASPFVDGDGALNSGKEPYLWFVFGNSPLPEEVSIASGKVKYKVAQWWKFFQAVPPVDGTLLVEMIQKDKIKYEWFAETQPEEVTDFTTAVKIYVR